MDDKQVRSHINRLSDEEEALYRDAGGGRLAPEELARLHAIQVELHRWWDLLHQREALRAAGLDPDQAHPRSAVVVEHYQQ